MKVIGNELHTENLIVVFHRTFRLPEDGKTYPLPRSVGRFPLKRIDDYKDKVPPSWVEKGGVFLPLHQREAMWIQFGLRTHAPCAVKVGVGKIDAITGEPWKDGLSEDKQDYLVAPPQKWIDGIKSEEGKVSQFVAMPLGMGYTVEGQVTGEEKHGGLQLAVYPGKREHFPKPKKRRGTRSRGVAKGGFATAGGASGQSLGWDGDDGFESYSGEVKTSGGHTLESAVLCSTAPAGAPEGVAKGFMRHAIKPTVIRRHAKRSFQENAPKAALMGMGAGGSMRQQVYPDPHGVHVWDQDCKQRVFVHLVNAEMYQQITGEAPPPSPIGKDEYFAAGIPWFDLYDKDLGDVEASETLGKVKTISEMDKDKGLEGQQDDSSAPVEEVVSCGTPKVVDTETVRDGSW